MIDNNLVDGGIFESLPVSELAQKYGKSRIVEFTFDQPEYREQIDKISTYIVSLIDCAIESNIQHSATSLMSTNLIKLPHKFSTLDFEAALSIGLDDHFDYVAQIVHQSLTQIISREERLEQIERDPSSLLRLINPTTSAKSLFDCVRSETILVSHCEMSIIANSLKDQIDPFYARMDSMIITYTVPRPQKQSLFPFVLYAFSERGDSNLANSEVEVSGDDYSRISFIPFVGEVESFGDIFLIPIYIFIDATNFSEDIKIFE